MLKKVVGVGAIGIVLPNAWVKPIISSVVLPVHAQTSSSLAEASLLGKWKLFISDHSRSSDLEFTSDADVTWGNFSYPYFRNGEKISLLIYIPYSVRGVITKVSGGLATEFVLTEGNRQVRDQLPLTGERI